MFHRNFAGLFIGLLVVAIGIAKGAPSTNGAPDPVAFLQKVQRDGAKAVVAQLNGAQWVAVLKGIESGSHEWLEVAVTLHGATDAGPSEMLTLAAGVALRRAPADVLDVVASELSVEGVCGLPDLTDSRTDTRDKAIKYLDARLKAVRAVTKLEKPALQEQCIRSLQMARHDVASSHGPFGHP
jgi:hypothetical protein